MSSRLTSAVLAVVLLAFGVVLWRQQQAIDRLASAVAGGGAVNAPVAAPPAERPGRTPPLSTGNVVVPLDGVPIRGQQGARVVVMEYSDFECPFCGRYVRDTLPRIDRDYVDTGRVQYAFRQFPLESLHPHAMGAAIVAACAAPRGQFWAMHDWLFAHQQTLEMPSLMAAAAGLGLGDASYSSCVEAREPAAMIQRTRAEAVRVGFTGTPGFLVGTLGADGQLHATRRLYGAVPYSLFQSAIDDVLAGK